MRDRFNDALKASLKSQDKRRTATLRLILAAIKDRDLAATGAGQEPLSAAQIVDVLGRMIKQRRESVRIYEEAGRCELALQEREEIVVIEEFLPKQLEPGEIRAAITSAVGATGAKGLKDMGRVMAWLKERYGGQMDFAKASAEVKSALG